VIPLEQALKTYLAVFAEPDRARRRALAAQCLTEEAEIVGPGYYFKGHEEILDKVDGFHERFPGARLVLASGFVAYRNIARFAVAIVDAQGAVTAEGDDVIELSTDGRIARVLTFWGPLPPTPASWPQPLSAPKRESA